MRHQKLKKSAHQKACKLLIDRQSIEEAHIAFPVSVLALDCISENENLSIW